MGFCPTATPSLTTCLSFRTCASFFPEICHKRGVLAIGGMTALYPSRTDAALNQRALTSLANDKHNEAACLMDGAWTGHPDQNQIALDQFPFPNQLQRRRAGAERYPDLRPVPSGVGIKTVAGTRAAIRTVIRYPQWSSEWKGSQPARRIYGRPGDRPDFTG